MGGKTVGWCRLGRLTRGGGTSRHRRRRRRSLISEIRITKRICWSSIFGRLPLVFRVRGGSFGIKVKSPLCSITPSHTVHLISDKFVHSLRRRRGTKCYRSGDGWFAGGRVLSWIVGRWGKRPVTSVVIAVLTVSMITVMMMGVVVIMMVVIRRTAIILRSHRTPRVMIFNGVHRHWWWKIQNRWEEKSCWEMEASFRLPSPRGEREIEVGRGEQMLRRETEGTQVNPGKEIWFEDDNCTDRRGQTDVMRKQIVMISANVCRNVWWQKWKGLKGKVSVEGNRYRREMGTCPRQETNWLTCLARHTTLLSLWLQLEGRREERRSPGISNERKTRRENSNRLHITPQHPRFSPLFSLSRRQYICIKRQQEFLFLTEREVGS